jgi:hypothetical protein
MSASASPSSASERVPDGMLHWMSRRASISAWLNSMIQSRRTTVVRSWKAK